MITRAQGEPEERVMITRAQGEPDERVMITRAQVEPDERVIVTRAQGEHDERVIVTKAQNEPDFHSRIMLHNKDKQLIYNSLVSTEETEENQVFKVTKSLIKSVPNNTLDYFKKWEKTISVFDDGTISRRKYAKMFPSLSIHDAIKAVSNTDIYLKLFWPFVLENAIMVQKLALFGLSGKTVSREKQKTTFFQELEKYQTIKIPAAQDRIVLSFNDPELVKGLIRSGLVEFNKDYLNAGFHLYSPEEQVLIENKVNAAVDLINATSPGLCRAIIQLIGSIAFYKAERPGYAGATISTALGVLWQDPRAYTEFSVPYFAEQIVHEFIHITLFLVDMVKNLFVDHKNFYGVKIWSPIRHQLRSYDRAFHACYVSTGLSAFHAQAGHTDRAEALARDLLQSVDELVTVNKAEGILTESGEAALEAMVDFLTLMRLK